MSIQLVVIVASISCGAVGLLIWPLVNYLRKCLIFDHPNERSSHVVATPKGAGLVFVPVICVTWFGVAWTFDDTRLVEISLLVFAGLLLALISWIDDLRSLPVVPRLAIHIAVVLVVTIGSPGLTTVFTDLLGPGMGMVFAVVLWVWFINLFNFMDGIDGISGVNILTISIGIGLTVLITNTADSSLMLYASCMAGAAMGFLIWNWPPARVFLGDVGSAPLGFFVGWLLLSLLQSEAYMAAVILPAYYLVDATLTLIKRAIRKEKFWQAHREHCYQMGVQRGLSQRWVCCVVLMVNVGLIGLALLSVLWSPALALIGAVVLVSGLLVYLCGWRSAAY